MMTTAYGLPGVNATYRGNGLTQVDLARSKPVTSAKQPKTLWSSGLGSLERSRGSAHVYDGQSELRGEQDIFGRAWDAAAWTRAADTQTAWEGGLWRGAQWSGAAWDGRLWNQVDWPLGTWSARTWRGDDWTARTWRDGRWTMAEGFTARTWRDANWSARTWRSSDAVGWEQATWQ
jgi:serine protease AprX